MSGNQERPPVANVALTSDGDSEWSIHLFGDPSRQHMEFPEVMEMVDRYDISADSDDQTVSRLIADIIEFNSRTSGIDIPYIPGHEVTLTLNSGKVISWYLVDKNSLA